MVAGRFVDGFVSISTASTGNVTFYTVRQDEIVFFLAAKCARAGSAAEFNGWYFMPKNGVANHLISGKTAAATIYYGEDNDSVLFSMYALHEGDMLRVNVSTLEASTGTVDYLLYRLQGR